MFDSSFLGIFASTFLAIITAGFLWIIRSAYEKHHKESVALARFERMLILNLRYNQDNFEFINKWIEVINLNRPFRFYIQPPILLKEETFMLSDLKLIQKLITLNYKIERIYQDLKNIYDHYWELINKFVQTDGKIDEQNIRALHNTIRERLDEMRKVQDPIEKEIFSAIAHIRVRAKVRKHSLFGYVSLINTDIIPRVTESSLSEEILKLEQNKQRLG